MTPKLPCPESGSATTVAAGLPDIALASWIMSVIRSAWSQVAWPPAEAPLVMTTVASPRAWSRASDANVPARFSRPRNQRRWPVEVTCGAVRLPAKAMPSQYLPNIDHHNTRRRDVRARRRRSQYRVCVDEPDVALLNICAQSPSKTSFKVGWWEMVGDGGR